MSEKLARVLNAGCCSAIKPCSHQRSFPDTLCSICQTAATTKSNRRAFEEIIAGLNYDGQDTDSLTIGEIKRSL